MNTFFRICIYYCLALLVFTLLFGLVNATGAFGIDVEEGLHISDTDSALGELSTLATPNMNYLIVLVAGGVAAGLVAGVLTQSIVPVGISVFGSVFWASYINTYSVLSMGNPSYIPGELLLIITVCTVLIFIAAIVGMLTGSG